MDGLSSAASGIAVISLAFQLADGVNKLCDFWNTVKDAPEDIQGIITDLRLLSTILSEMAVEDQHIEPDSALAAVLKACNDKIIRLAGLTNDLEPGFASRRLRVRQWTSLKAVLKGDRIQKFLKELEGLKSTLLLAQQHHNGRFNRLRSQTHEQGLTAIERSLTSLSLQLSSATIITQSTRLSGIDSHTQALRTEAVRIGRTMPSPVQRRGFEVCSESAVQEIASGHMENQSAIHGNRMEPKAGFSSAPSSHQPWSSSPARTWTSRTLERKASTISTVFGTISIYSIIRQLRSSIDEDPILKEEDQDPEYEYKSSFKVFPAPWLLKLGFNYGYNISTSSSPYQGWTNNIQPFTLVPDDALVFEFCKLGDLAAVRSLFLRNLASVRDTNSEGLTALHIAARCCHPTLCDFLVTAGADKNARTFEYWPQTPIEYAAHYHRCEDRFSDVVDTHRLLLDSLDWGSDGNGWNFLHDIAYWPYKFVAEASAAVAFMLWLIRSSSLEIQTNYHEDKFHYLLISHTTPMLADAISALKDLSPRRSVDTFGTFQESALFTTVARQRWGAARLLLTMGADPHLLSVDSDNSPRSETPTSIAMYSSWRFWSFRNVLREANIDIESYIQSGLGRAGPLIDDGWQVETLRVLFQYEFEPEFGPEFKPESGDLWDYAWKCSNNDHKVYHMVGVQSRWQHILERIKRGINGDALSSNVSNVQRVQDSSVESRFTIVSQPSHTNIRNDGDLFPDPPSSGFKAAQIVSTSPAIDIDVPSSLLERGTVICMHCWLYLKEHGHLPPQESTEAYLEDSLEDSTENSSDDSSEDEFSPFLIHG